MKKTVAIVLATCLMFLQVFFLSIPDGYAVDAPEVYSNEALVVDLNTGEVLYHKNTKEESVQIASLTKIMTFVLTVENIADLQTKIQVPIGTQYAIALQDGSHASLEDGYAYTALDLLYGLMLPSGCDAADTLASYISNGNYDGFVTMMNAKASELGMDSTVFCSASGLDRNGKNNLSTEQDLYKLAKYAFSLPYFQEIIGTEYYVITGTKNAHISKNTVRNTNYMMGEYNGAEYYYPYSLGGKTGNTSKAGRCLISFAQKGDLQVVAITLGVPERNDNYHFTDHKALFEYVFDHFTENITVEIGSEYKSVGIGEKIQMIPVTSEKTKITWKSSDESVAVVNEYGIVTGKKLGQAKITATTETGNQDYAHVSVGFYNGVDVKYSSGPANPNGTSDRGPIDGALLKNYGMDFAIIRAGYTAGSNSKGDPSFARNVEGALANDIHVMISFDGCAAGVSAAREEAEFLVEYLRENIPQYLERIKLPIVYNLSNCGTSNGKTLVNAVLAFQNVLKAQGFEVMAETKNNIFSAAELKILTDSGVGLYVIHRPYLPDYQTRMLATSGIEEYSADLWQYRSDAYFGEAGIARRVIMSAMYMDAFRIDTAHGVYDEIAFPEKPELTVEGRYTYTGENITAAVAGFDPETMEIAGNVEVNAGTYTVTVRPKTNWKDGSKDPVSAVWVIEKAVPEVERVHLQAMDGTPLGDISLPPNYQWANPDEKVDRDGENRFQAIYSPEDGENYLTVEVELTVEVQPNTPKPTEPTPTGSGDSIVPRGLTAYVVPAMIVMCAVGVCVVLIYRKCFKRK